MAWLSKLRVKICLLVMVVGSVAGAYTLFKLFYPMTSQKVSVTSPPLEFSMELDKTKFQYSENITIKFRLENIGNKTIEIIRGSPPHWPPTFMETSYGDVQFSSPGGSPILILREFYFGLHVTYINGTEIYDIQRGILTYCQVFSMNSGGWIEQTIIWDFDTTLETWDGLFMRKLSLSQGTYQIKGIFRYMVNAPSRTLETPSITFTIE